MLFEWDEAKSRRTLDERGFGFEYAARIFLAPTLERPDDRREYGEVRIQASRRGWLIGRSVDYGNHSPNNGRYPPNEAAH